MHRMVRGVLVAVLALTVLAACGDDDPPAPEPSGSTTSPTETPSPSETTGPSDEPSVEPASGKQETFGSFTMNFPKGFDISRPAGLILVGTGPDVFIAVHAIETVTQDSLNALARIALADAVYKGKPVRKENLVADGVPMFHVSGPIGAGRTRDLVGVEYGGFQMQLDFTTSLPEPARQQLIDSVLASITWS